MILDGELLERYAKNQDQTAFAELVRRHLDGVFSAALRRVGGDRHLAEDVAQQVFIELARQSRRLSHHPVLAGWLYVTTRNKAVMLVRAEQRRKVREAEAHLMNERDDDLSSVRDWSRVAPVIDSAIDQLPEADRLAVLLRFVARKPFEEIAATLKVSPDAARMRVGRATEKLRLILARKGVISTAALLTADLANCAAAAAPASLGTNVISAALAAGPAATGSFVAAIQFMATSKLTAGVLTGALVLVAVGSATHRHRLAAEAERSLAAATDRRDSIVADLRSKEERIHDLATSVRDLEKRIADERSSSEAASAAAAKRSTRADLAANGAAFLKKHPEARKSISDWADRLTDAHYQALYQALHFTQAQIEEFRLLMRGDTWVERPIDQQGRVYARLGLDTGISRDERQRLLQNLLGAEGIKLLEKVIVSGRRNSSRTSLPPWPFSPITPFLPTRRND